MLIRATEKVNTPSHSLKKGDVVNMRGADAEKLIKKGFAEAFEEKETQAEIINGLNIEDDVKAYLTENIGEFELTLKKDKTLSKKSEDKVNEIIDGMHQ